MRPIGRWRKVGLAIAVIVVAAVAVAGMLRERSEPLSEPSAGPSRGADYPQTSARFARTSAGDGRLPRITARGHDLLAGKRRFEVWGFNYGIGDRYLILDYFSRPTKRRQARVFEDMREARALGANTLRIYLEIGTFMRNPREPRLRALRAYRDVVAEARRLGIYLDVTGDLVWRKAPWWYDALGEQRRWKVQARFWRAVADVSSRSRAVLMYELTSEPNVTDSDSWYDGELGGLTFVQNIVRRLDGRDPQRLARAWTRKMRNAVRSRDRRHLISIGFMPFCGGPFAHEGLLDLLDLLVVHSHPQEETQEESIESIRDFSDHGTPVVLGETSPMFTKSWPEFLTELPDYVDGYLYYYDGRRPSEIDATSTPGLFLRASLKQFLALRESLVGSPSQRGAAESSTEAAPSPSPLAPQEAQRRPDCPPA